VVVRRNTDEVQSKANFDLFEELIADDFVDHRPQPAGTPDKSGARKLYYTLRAAFPDFHAIIHFAQRHSIVVPDSDSAPPTRSASKMTRTWAHSYVAPAVPMQLVDSSSLG
jgi:hypothetical protein